MRSSASSAVASYGDRIWHIATVSADSGGGLWLDFPDPSSCARCALGNGCGAAHLTRLFIRSGSRLPLASHHGFRPGEKVRAGVDSRWLLRAACVSYVVPVLAFLTGAIGAQAMWPGSDIPALLGGLLGTGLALALLHGPLARLTQPRLSLERLADEPVERLESRRDGAHLDRSRE